jgi:hypothetical protein
VFALFATLALLADARADETAWRIFLHPKFLRAPVTAPVAGAQRTEYAAGVLGPDTLDPWTKPDFTTLGLSWADYATKAAKNAETDLAGLTPRYERDKRGSILYAELRAERPIVAAAVLAPGFLARWHDTLGEKVIVAVPNRTQAFIFPRLASDWQAYAPMMLRAYRETAHPVSLEVFEVSTAGWRCLGAYESP